MPFVKMMAITPLACIPKLWQGKASKRQWHHSGVAFAKMIILLIPNTKFINDGDVVQLGDVVFHVWHYDLKAERMVLNSMQRMSALLTKRTLCSNFKRNGNKNFRHQKDHARFRVAENGQ
jgi:nicotinate-nucleotide pyrophosphorylase (carboxylating)